MSSALTGGFFTAESPGKPQIIYLISVLLVLLVYVVFIYLFIYLFLLIPGADFCSQTNDILS